MPKTIAELHVKYLGQMAKVIAANRGDTEGVHAEADALLVRLLRELGMHKLAREYCRLEKWYA